MNEKNVLIRDLAFFAFMIPAVILFWRSNLIAGLILFSEATVAQIFFYKNSEKIFFVFAGIFGTVLEMIGGIIGIWTYTYPNLITVPFWIFFCWGFTFMLLNSAYSLVKNRLNKQG
ncbi:hypothetical protein A3K63_04765 [Candidatus Micrarchaeota archaeon RBG_16_49_10]|nr:MAG: hypothetical protein A3K63_04765 [Candidatus Micrarchaeota archaeon RBG_16_49_10]